jgi:hypothetical protein
MAGDIESFDTDQICPQSAKRKSFGLLNWFRDLEFFPPSRFPKIPGTFIERNADHDDKGHDCRQVPFF